MGWPLRFPISALLITGLGLGPMHFSQAKDVKGLATAAIGLGAAGFTAAAYDIAMGGKDCFCQALGRVCPDGNLPWQTCVMLPLAVGSAAGMAASMMMNGDTKKAVTSSGDGGGGAANIPTADLEAIRGLIRPDGSLSPDVNAGLDAYKSLLNDGKISAPDGLTPEEALSKLDNDLNTLKDYANSIEGDGLTPEETLASDPNAAGPGSGGARGATYDGDDGDFSLGGRLRASPVDRSGLGATTIMGSLQMFDDETGKQLTLWQRATRKYQGMPDGKRAFIMAKMEFIRAEALRRQKLELASKELTKKSVAQKTKTEPAAVRRAPASSKVIPLKH